MRSCRVALTEVLNLQTKLHIPEFSNIINITDN